MGLLVSILMNIKQEQRKVRKVRSIPIRISAEHGTDIILASDHDDTDIIKVIIIFFFCSNLSSAV